MKHHPSLTSAHDEDKHYKMCKKIAQLTKVIYTFNSRSEDNEQRTAWLHQAHVAELTRLRQEYEGQIEVLQKQAKALQVERVNLASSLEVQHKEQLLGAQKAFQSRTAELTAQVTEQLAKFESALRANKQQMATEIAAEAKRIREGKDAELEDLVQEYNGKYKSMLAEQLDSRDALEEELNRKWSVKVQALEAQLAGTQGDNDRQMQAKSKLLQETLQKCAVLSNEKDTLASQLEVAQTQARTLQESVSKAVADLGSERHQLKSSEELNGKLEAKLTDLQRELACLAKQYRDSQEGLTAEKASHSRSTAAQKALENEKALLSTAKDAAEHELKECKELLAKRATECDAVRKELDTLRSSTEAKSSSLGELRTELSTAQQRVAMLDRELEDVKRQHASSMAQAQQRLEEAAQHALEGAQAADAKYQAELRDAQHALQSASASELQKLMEKHAMQIEATERKQVAEMQQLQAQLSAAKEGHGGLSGKLSEATAHIDSLEQRREELEAQLRAQVQEMAEERAEAAAQIARLRQDLEHTRSNGLEEAGAQQAALERLQAEHATACAEADAAHAKALQELRDRGAESEETTKREHTALLQSIQKEHAASLQRVKDEATARFASATCDADARRAEEKKELVDKLEAQRGAAAAVERELRRQVAALDGQLSELQSASSAQQASSASQLQELQQQLSQLQDALLETKAEAATALAAARRTADAQRQDDITALEATRQKQVNAERQRYDAAAAAHRKEMERLEARMKERVASAETRLKATVTQLEAKHSTELEKLKADLHSAYEAQVRAVESTHEAERTQLQDALAVNEKKLRDQSLHISDDMQTITSLTAQRDQALEEVSAEKRNSAAAITAAQNKHAADVEMLHINHQGELNKLAATHKAFVDDYLVQQAEARAAHQAQVDQFRQSLEALQFKYNYRESRAEDVELINQLLAENKEKEMALTKAYEDMRVYKLELINREENYNKLFRRNPAVADYSGIAEAITRKECSSLPVISATRKQATR